MFYVSMYVFPQYMLSFQCIIQSIQGINKKKQNSLISSWIFCCVWNAIKSLTNLCKDDKEVAEMPFIDVKAFVM